MTTAVICRSGHVLFLVRISVILPLDPAGAVAAG